MERGVWYLAGGGLFGISVCLSHSPEAEWTLRTVWDWTVFVVNRKFGLVLAGQLGK